VWAGSGDLSANGGEINGVLVKNQPGSAMKPFLYALALEMGFSPMSVLPDVPSDFGTEQVYVPLNFDNRYNGPVLFRNALASSLNVPAVYLLYRIGIDNYLAKLESLGFESLAGTREGTGLSLALGSGEVTLFELVRAFSVFARDGTIPSLTMEVVGVAGARSPAVGGVPLTQQSAVAGRGAAPPSQVFQKDTARIICSILSDRRARASGFAFSTVLSPPYPAIFKTGTANQFQDIVALGGTSQYTAGVWMGNFSGETVIGKTGSSIPAEVVRALLDALGAQNAENFLLPARYSRVNVCTLSGFAPNADCPSVTQEFSPLGLEQTLKTCTWHYRENGRVMVRYPDEYQRWFLGKNTAAQLFKENEPLTFLYPAAGAVFMFEDASLGSTQQMSVDVRGGSAQSARLFVNGVFAGEKERPFTWNVPLARGNLVLSVLSGEETAEITITVK
jgi:penicillin-binding protein 1C